MKILVLALIGLMAVVGVAGAQCPGCAADGVCTFGPFFTGSCISTGGRCWSNGECYSETERMTDKGPHIHLGKPVVIATELATFYDQVPEMAERHVGQTFTMRYQRWTLEGGYGLDRVLTDPQGNRKVVKKAKDN